MFTQSYNNVNSLPEQRIIYMSFWYSLDVITFRYLKFIDLIGIF